LTVSKSGDQYLGVKADTPLVSILPSSSRSRVSVIDGLEWHVIEYKWLGDRKWIFFVIVIWALCGEIPLFVNYVGSVGWDNFNLIDYPSFLIVSLALGYAAAIVIFDKTTTVITDAIFSVRRGPLPCFWPGDYVCPIEEATQVYISGHVLYGSNFYYVYVTVEGGRQFNLFTVHDGALAREWGRGFRDGSTRSIERNWCRFTLLTNSRAYSKAGGRLPTARGASRSCSRSSPPSAAWAF
jgi:hypothetical protein